MKRLSLPPGVVALLTATPARKRSFGVDGDGSFELSIFADDPRVLQVNRGPGDDTAAVFDSISEAAGYFRDHYADIEHPEAECYSTESHPFCLAWGPQIVAAIEWLGSSAP